MLIITNKNKNPYLWLAAHLDVVPGSNDQFVPKVDGDRLYGRGAYDIKMAIAVFMQIFQDQDCRDKLSNVGIMITSDEEIGGMNGTNALI